MSEVVSTQQEHNFSIFVSWFGCNSQVKCSNFACFSVKYVDTIPALLFVDQICFLGELVNEVLNRLTIRAGESFSSSDHHRKMCLFKSFTVWMSTLN